jgi:hypothetical protein
MSITAPTLIAAADPASGPGPQRELFFREFGERYAELADDAAVAAERAGEAGSLSDGLDDEPPALR